MRPSQAFPADATEAEADPFSIASEEARRSRTNGPRSLKCVGKPVFRTQLARDLSMLLDVDQAIASWRCLPTTVARSDTESGHVPDFAVCDTDGGLKYVDAVPDGAIEVANTECGDIILERIPAPEIRAEPRLTNARDLLRYGFVRVSLSDRVKLLTILNEGPVPIGDVLRSYRPSAAPVAVIASLFLHRYISMDIESEAIGPETVIQRRRA